MAQVPCLVLSARPRERHVLKGSLLSKGAKQKRDESLPARQRCVFLTSDRRAQAPFDLGVNLCRIQCATCRHTTIAAASTADEIKRCLACFLLRTNIDHRRRTRDLAREGKKKRPITSVAGAVTSNVRSSEDFWCVG